MSTEKLENLPITQDQPDEEIWAPEAEKLYDSGQINAAQARQYSGSIIVSKEVESGDFIPTTSAAATRIVNKRRQTDRYKNGRPKIRGRTPGVLRQADERPDLKPFPYGPYGNND